jgi:leucyl-tRNA synthetase
MISTRDTFPFSEFEPEWQKRWDNAGIFFYEPPAAPGTPKWNIIELPPFANGKLHLGHVRNYVLADASARYRRMNGFVVLYTSGFDSFGLPNELAALEAGRHPCSLAEEVIAQMRGDFLRLGLSHDTRRVIGYHGESYYRWIQWVFLRLFEHGLAYRRKAPLPWCPSCNCTLADSLSEGGICWRCKQPVETRTIAQWFVREADFAEELLDGLDRLPGWPAKIKKIHTDWIGRREGASLVFQIAGAPDVELTAFLPDPSCFPAIAAVLMSPDHPALEEWIRDGRVSPAVVEQLREARRSSPTGDHQRGLSSRSQGQFSGVRLGLDARHALLGQAVPIIALAELDLRFHDGLMLLCPERIRGDAKIAESLGLAFEPAKDGEPETCGASDWIARLEETASGRGEVRYRLRDWNFARQRYWGPPVPIVHCEICGEVAVPDAELPVVLPADVDLSSPQPLRDHAAFVNTACPRCGGVGCRDTDTLEAYSSPWWYRWNSKGTSTESPFDAIEARAYMPVDLMIGGEDQARSCFFHVRMMAKALNRIGVVEETEPVERLVAIGMVKSNGRKMSKSEGNTVDPFDLVKNFGADALRLAMMGAAAPDNEFNWDDALVAKSHAFLAGVWAFFERNRGALDLSAMGLDEPADTTYSMAAKFERQMTIAVSRVTSALESHHFHLAVSNLMPLFDRIDGYEEEALKRRRKLDARDEQVLRVAAGTLLRLLAPLCPHIAEELWRTCKGNGFVAQARWPGASRANAQKEDRSHAASAASDRTDR